MFQHSRYLQFADDSKLYLNINSTRNYEILQNDLKQYEA